MNQSKRLLVSALSKFVVGLGILGLYLFACAGDMQFWNAWLYLAAFAVCIFSLGAFLYSNDKELLHKRLKSKEKEKEQDIYTYAAGISIFAVFGMSGLDYRLSWSSVPLAAVIIALAAMLAGYGLFVATMIQNRFASRIVEIQDRQKVIETGVYSVIRHPMYTAALTMFFASPIVLGSYYALIPMAIFLTGIVFRIRNEEMVLCNGLDGYAEYMKRIKYRLIPFVW